MKPIIKKGRDEGKEKRALSLPKEGSGHDMLTSSRFQGIPSNLDDGISIHFMPNRYWKLATILLYIPNRVAVLMDKILAGRIFRRRSGHKWFRTYKRRYTGHNIKIGRRRQFFLSKLFLPRIHGVSKNTIAELIVFGKKQWIRKFESAGFKVLAVKKVAYSSGYGFGFDRLRKLMVDITVVSMLPNYMIRRI